MKKKLNNSGAKSAPMRIACAAVCLVLGFSFFAPVGVAAAGADSASESYVEAAQMSRAIPASEESALGARAGKINYNLPGVSNKSIYAHQRLTATVNGKTLSEGALVMNGITYLPLRSAIEAIGWANISYNSSTRTMSVRMNGLTLSATDGAFVTYANDRPLFAFSPSAVMSNGRMYIPASVLTKATGMSFSVSSSTVSVSGTYKPLATAASYYRSDEVFWLARIITAESGGESLLGQIAVGDVILNRVKSPQYPNTIYSVIFDRRYGVQFSPAANGTIYNTPTYTATLAAKICLEGVSLSDNAMYFINPRLAPNSWVSRNRPYAYTIGGHDFYL